MPTILLVDDDLNMLSAMALPLESAGYRVLRASRLDQAGRIVATDELDLVLLDVAADQGRGWDLLREIIEFRNVPVIVVSSHAIEDDIVSALDIGAVDFVPKPFRTGELLARVRARLRTEPRPRSPLPPVALPTVPMVEPARPIREEYATPVFMDAAEEQALLDERAAAGQYEGNIEELPLGERLRAARQRKGLSLVQVELDTKLRIWYIQAMEETRFGLLPRGAAAERMVRAYAGFLGLNADHAVRDFRTAYAEQPTRQVANLGAAPPPREIPQGLIVIVAALLALVGGVGGFWLLAPNQVAALSANVRSIVNPPTATATPTPTLPPTVTPTRTPAPTATSTPAPTSTETPRPTDTPQPTPEPALTPAASP